MRWTANYTRPDAVLFWLSRSVYLGLAISAVFLDGIGAGEFAMLHPIHPLLLPLALGGLLAYEVGVWMGTRSRPVVRVAAPAEMAAVPLLLWCVALAATVLLFLRNGIPYFTNPDLRASIGQGAGILKRLASVWLPLAAVELFAIMRRPDRATVTLGWLPALVTLGVLVAITAKAPILLFLALLVLVDARGRRGGRTLMLVALAGLLVGVVMLYASLVADGDTTFLALMGFRLTTMAANMPNYILWGLPGVPTAGDLLWHDGWSVLSTLHVPFVPHPPLLETALSERVLGRWVEQGGLSPTVVGEGWILGGMAGVLGLSLLYGYVTGALVRLGRTSAVTMHVGVAYFGAFAMYYPMQFFAVGAFLDWGVSLITYLIAHAIVAQFVRLLEVPTSVPATVESC